MSYVRVQNNTGVKRSYVAGLSAYGRAGLSIHAKDSYDFAKRTL
jgi:hypothetical protein